MRPVPSRLLVGVLLVGVVLLALSAVIDSPAANAAPELYGGGIALVAGGSIARFAGTSRRPLLVSGLCLLVGGFVVTVVGLSTLGVVPAFPERELLELVGDVALLVGVAGFVYWRYGARWDSPGD